MCLQLEKRISHGLTEALLIALKYRPDASIANPKNVFPAMTA
ncbi:MAG TPA: hypothetical protein VHD56_06405 [Tepidisphaeraceae bacterium]|nr:hypothetical protein [Tepidisphaeraceae bacterium]